MANKSLKKRKPPVKKEVPNEVIDVKAEEILDIVTGDKNVYVAEQNTSGAPKTFFIRCPRCRWARISSGVKADVSDLFEIDAGCKTCGKWRKFKCPKCGTSSPMKRIKGNTQNN